MPQAFSFHFGFLYPIDNIFVGAFGLRSYFFNIFFSTLKGVISFFLHPIGVFAGIIGCHLPIFIGFFRGSLPCFFSLFGIQPVSNGTSGNQSNSKAQQSVFLSAHVYFSLVNECDLILFKGSNLY